MFFVLVSIVNKQGIYYNACYIIESVDSISRDEPDTMISYIRPFGGGWAPPP